MATRRACSRDSTLGDDDHDDQLNDEEDERGGVASMIDLL
jgi:hypothetical protein